MRKVLVLAFVAFFSLIYTDVWGTVNYGDEYSVSSNVLTIHKRGDFANGIIPSYASASSTPWVSYQSSATTIVVSDGFTQIGSYAFGGFNKVTTVTLPESLTTINKEAFSGCSSMANVKFKGTPAQWASIEFKGGGQKGHSHPLGARTSGTYSYYFYGTATASTTLFIEPIIDKINNCAFYRGNFSSVCIPGTIGTIGDSTFYGCASLTEIIVNRHVAPTLGTSAFYGIASGTASNVQLYKPSTNSGYGVSPWSTFTKSTTETSPCVTSGTLDEGSIPWTLDTCGILTIDATDVATKSISFNKAGAAHPWGRFRRMVYKIVIKGEITGIGYLGRYHFGLSEILLDQTAVPTSQTNIAYSSSAYNGLFNQRDKLTLSIKSASEGHANLSSAPWNDAIHWNIVVRTCPDWSLHYGTDGVADWAEECFTYTGSSNEWQIEDFVIPDKPNWYVDNAAGNDPKKVLSTWSNLYFAASQGDGDRPMVGDATGAIGTVRIYDNSTWNNRYAGFIPNGYVLKIGSTEYPFTFESGNEYRTEIFEYNSTNARDNVSVGIEDADGHFISTDNTSEMQHLFLKVSSDWASDGAKFSIYDIDASSFKYGFMTLVPGTTDLYEGWVDGTCGNVIFVRHNSTATSPSFAEGNKWNQTGDLALQSGKNYFTINQGTWDGQTEGWSAYTRRGRYCIWQNSIEKNWGVCFRPCHEFNATENANWSNANNWSPNSLPTINHDVIINKPAVVNTTSAVAKSVIINQSDDNTGKIEIAAGQKLIVANTIRKTTDGESLSVTDADDITIHSDGTNGLGALVMGTHDGTNKATVNFYTKSNGEDGNNTSVGQYVGTPFNDENNILYNWYNSWVYGITYSGAGAIDWYRVNEGEGMNPYKGYCVFSADGTGHSYWQQGTLVASENQNLSGLNWQSGSGTANANNENLLANSWVAPIKINAMESSDFTNADATVYIFNSTSNSAYVDLGNYATYPVNSAADAAIIPSMQSFSVFTTGSGASVSLDYSKIVYDPAVGGTVPGPNKAPRLTKAETAHRMKLYVSAENGYSDMLYLLEHLDFEEGFENGWDGHKLFGEPVAPQLYAVTPDGNMAVNCVPTYEGVVLGFKAGEQDQNYTFRFEYDDETQPLYLLDISTNAYTQIMNENHYSFITSDNEAHNRFVLTYKAPNITTAINNTNSPLSNTGKKVIYDNQLYIIHNGRIFSAQGMMVK